MANKATITYNGKDVLTEEKEGNFDVLYKENVIATLGVGQSKTLFCKNKVMRSDIKIGSKTLFCKAKKMYSDIKIKVESLFPSAPSSYDLIATYTSSQTWTAPEDGWFQIEVFGASGKGGNSDLILISSTRYNYGTGGGGGGGGYACSRIKMNKGDTIVLTVGAVGATTIADINSSLESYSSPQVTSGGNGTEGKRISIISSTFTAGTGGAGGVASGGNYSNANGNAGTNGAAVENQSRNNNSYFASGGAGANGAPTGGASASVKAGGDNGEVGTVGSGSAGFIKIYRGNTN